MVAFKRKRIIGQGKMAMQAMAKMDEVPEFHMYGKNVDIREAPARLLISPEIHEIERINKTESGFENLFPILSDDPLESGGRAKAEADVDILKIDWAIRHPEMKVTTWLTTVKGYSQNQAARLFVMGGSDEGWNEGKRRVSDGLTAGMVRRHIDQMAEVQETHIKASKIGLAKAVEMLSKFSIDAAKNPDGSMMLDGKGRPVYRGFRSIDLLNCLSAVEKAQSIYRRAMGLPNDEAGMAQLLGKLQVNVAVVAQQADPVRAQQQALAETLTYEQILEFVEYRREQKRAAIPI